MANSFLVIRSFIEWMNSAKPSPEDRGVVHHGIDIVDERNFRIIILYAKDD